MPVDPVPVCRFVAEPPQDPLPDGRWATTLERHFLGACDPLDEEEEGLGDPGEVVVLPRPHVARAHVRARRRR